MLELIELLKEIRDDIDFDNCDELIDGGLLDSFDVIQIVAQINRKYEIEIPAVYINSENFNSVGAIYNMIKKLME